MQLTPNIYPELWPPIAEKLRFTKGCLTDQMFISRCSERILLFSHFKKLDSKFLPVYNVSEIAAGKYQAMTVLGR